MPARTTSASRKTLANRLGHPLVLLSILVFGLKGTLLICCCDTSRMNVDEEKNFQIAENVLAGNGYTLDGKVTAFHGSFPVYVYQGLLRLSVSKTAYIKSIHWLSIALFVASLWPFYATLRDTRVGSRTAFVATCVYAMYPSSLMYIGNIFCYEKMALPMLVTVYCILQRLIQGQGVSLPTQIATILLMSLSCLLRGQLIIIYAIIVSVFITLTVWQRDAAAFRRIVIPVVCGAVTIAICHVPFVVKNYRLFGAPIVSTQVGFELLQGHNPLARGSWTGTWKTPGSPYYRYSHSSISNLSSLNEYEESNARKRLALNWILENPAAECVLLVRKTVMFFLPRNYKSGWNVLNFAVHAAFLGLVFLAVVRGQWSSTATQLASPVAAALLLSLVFFVGARWRYYAEPFMIAVIAYQLSQFSRSPEDKIIRG